MKTPVTPSDILVVEDEPAISDIVATALRFEKHTVTLADHGRTGLDLALEGRFDLIVLDVMLPGLHGFEICRRLRDQDVSTPVLFLTAREGQHDRIEGFEIGGDDYLTKPFSVAELVLRVGAILRRARQAEPTDQLVVGDLTLDPAGQQVHHRGDRVELSVTEFRLLQYLMINHGVVVSKAQILVNVWDFDYTGSGNVVELYVGYLRRKLGHDDTPIIHTRRGAGYVLRQDTP